MHNLHNCKWPPFPNSLHHVRGFPLHQHLARASSLPMLLSCRNYYSSLQIGLPLSMQPYTYHRVIFLEYSSDHAPCQWKRFRSPGCGPVQSWQLFLPRLLSYTGTYWPPPGFSLSPTLATDLPHIQRLLWPSTHIPGRTNSRSGANSPLPSEGCGNLGQYEMPLWSNFNSQPPHPSCALILFNSSPVWAAPIRQGQ